MQYNVWCEVIYVLKLSVGYQYNEDAIPFSRIVENYKESISEVYFAWIDHASGRSKLSGFDGYFDYGLQDIMIKELRKINPNPKAPLRRYLKRPLPDAFYLLQYRL